MPSFPPNYWNPSLSPPLRLHDGAVIIRGTTILSAATILPLADDSTHLSKSMGTRHRAGLGISQLTDALVIVVSEETGKVSIARDGIMTRGVKVDRFKGIIRSVFSPPKTSYPFQLKHLGTTEFMESLINNLFVHQWQRKLVGSCCRDCHLVLCQPYDHLLKNTFPRSPFASLIFPLIKRFMACCRMAF